MLWYIIIIISILLGFSYSLIYFFQQSYINNIDTKLYLIAQDIRDDFKENQNSYNEIDEGEEFDIKPFFAHILKIEGREISIVATSPKLEQDLLPIQKEIYNQISKNNNIFFSTSNSSRAIVFF